MSTQRYSNALRAHGGHGRCRNDFVCCYDPNLRCFLGRTSSGGHDARCTSWTSTDPTNCTCRRSDGKTPRTNEDTQPMPRVSPTGPPCEAAS
jgi:hypothetical protein